MTESNEILTCQRVLSLMVLVGFMIHHIIRVNIAIAIVEMVAKNSSNSSYETHGPRFNWDEEEKNNIMGCFFWGYVITQIPGGRLSEKFGTKIVVGIGLFAASILTLITPLASQWGYYWLILVRFSLGIAMGIHWPSTSPIATRWIPPSDTAKFMSHMTASSLGISIILPISGYLIAYFGWPSVFYVTGSVALIWNLCWWFIIYDSPEKHPRISEKEKLKLRRKVKIVESTIKKPIPWKKIMTSGPVWAVIVANICQSCTFFIALNQLPTYMSQILHFNIKQNGWFSSLPYLARYFSSVTSSIAADKIQKSGRFTTTTIRKFLTVCLFSGTLVLFTIQAIWGYDRILTVVVFTSSLALMGLSTPGFHANSIDIAPAYSGTIFGISQVPGALSGYFTTKFVAMVTKEAQRFEQWSYVFWMLVGVNLFGAIFSWIFISGEEQSWSKQSEEKELEMLKSVNEEIKNKE